METLVLCLDSGRAALLRRTMRVEGFRVLFRDRAGRLLALFGLACAVALAGALWFPLWVLAVGPLLYGFPHLVSGLRHVPRALGRPRGGLAVPLIAAAAVAAAHFASAEPGNIPELAATAAITLYYGRKAAPLLLFAPLAWISLRSPAAAIGAILLLHNAVGFIYWARAGKTRREVAAALASLAVFAAVNALLFAGALDAAIRPGYELRFAGLDSAALGRMISAGAGDPMVWIRCVVAYAFGQSLHYFVWLKAIPDQQHSSEMPTSFRQALRLLESDFGKLPARIAIGACLVAIPAWGWLGFASMRIVYLTISAFHGYFELAGLTVIVFTRAIIPEG